jgi:hypothetical protein
MVPLKLLIPQLPPLRRPGTVCLGKPGSAAVVSSSEEHFQPIAISMFSLMGKTAARAAKDERDNLEDRDLLETTRQITYSIAPTAAAQEDGANKDRKAKQEHRAVMAAMVGLLCCRARSHSRSIK